MDPNAQRKAEGLAKARERALMAAKGIIAEQGWVGVIEVFESLGWLSPGTVSYWQQGRSPPLFDLIQVGPEKFRVATETLFEWAKTEGHVQRMGTFTSRTPERTPLAFTRVEDAAMAALLSTQWVSRDVPARSVDRVTKKADEPPELLAYEKNSQWTCAVCGADDVRFFMLKNEGTHCVACMGLGVMEYLPGGDAALTRRASKHSSKRVLVLKWSRARKRYERQGILVDEGAIEKAQKELHAERR